MQFIAVIISLSIPEPNATPAGGEVVAKGDTGGEGGSERWREEGRAGTLR